jgi:predicted acylesterase/phospholipase RssA
LDYDKVEKIVLAQCASKYFKWNWFRQLGIFDPSAIRKLIDEELKLTWADLKIPFKTVATVVETGETLWFDTEKPETLFLTLGEVLQATSAMPLIFRSPRVFHPNPGKGHPNQVHLVDGGVLENFLGEARHPIVASYLGFEGVRDEPMGESFPNDWIPFAVQLFTIMQYRLLKPSLDKVQVVVKHPYTWNRNYLKAQDAESTAELISLAYENAKSVFASSRLG